MKKIDIDIDLARELYEQGLSFAKVGEQLKVGGRVIAARFYENHIPTRGKLRESERFTIDKAVKLYYDEGYSLAEVGEKLWVSADKVKRELLAAGYKIRSVSEYYAHEEAGSRRGRNA